MLNKKNGFIILGIFVIMFCSFMFYHAVLKTGASEQTQQSNVSTEKIQIIKNSFQEEQGKITEDLSNANILISPTAKYQFDSENQRIIGVTYTNVDLIGHSTKITEKQAEEIAKNFAKEHFAKFDTTNCETKIAHSSCYAVVLTEVDKSSGIKLLNKFTAIINQETGQVATAFLNSDSQTNLPDVKINKAEALTIAIEAINKEFSGASLVRSSDTPEEKWFSKEDNPEEHDGDPQVGWIFIFESSEHSGGVFVNVNDGKTKVQWAY